LGRQDVDQQTTETLGEGAAPAAERETAASPGEALERYVHNTLEVDWVDGSVRPLPGESVIVAYEEEGAVRHLRTRWDPAAGGWRERWLRGRKLYWIHDPPL
jgi:hypothetical protein